MQPVFSFVKLELNACRGGTKGSSAGRSDPAPPPLHTASQDSAQQWLTAGVKAWPKLWWHLFITHSPTWTPFCCKRCYPNKSFHFLLNLPGWLSPHPGCHQLPFPPRAAGSCWFADTHRRYPPSRKVLQALICQGEAKQREQA